LKERQNVVFIKCYQNLFGDSLTSGHGRWHCCGPLPFNMFIVVCSLGDFLRRQHVVLLSISLNIFESLWKGMSCEYAALHPPPPPVGGTDISHQPELET
jgi:hypothetical protein